MTHDVTICFVEEDKIFADKVYSGLINNSICPKIYNPQLKDVEGNSLNEFIVKSKVIVFILSSNSISSFSIKEQLRLASDKEVPIINLRVEDVYSSGELAQIINSYKFINALDKSFERPLYLLVQDIKKLLGIEFSLDYGDITTFNGDVAVFKYAKDFYGVDKVVSSILSDNGFDINYLKVKPDDYKIINTNKCLGVKNVIFMGVESLDRIEYADLKQLAVKVLEIINKELPNTKHLLMTLHGPNFGLDEIKSFNFQFKGYMDVIRDRNVPKNLNRITIVENDLRRLKRLRREFKNNIKLNLLDIYPLECQNGIYRLPTAGYDKWISRGISVKKLGKASYEEDTNINEKIPLVFISYDSKDKVIAYTLCGELEANNICCWIAPRDILPGEEWDDAIVKAIEQCKIMVLVFSDHINTSFYVKGEIHTAVSEGLSIVTFRIEDALPQKGLRLYLPKKQWLDAITPPLERHIQILIRAVKALIELKEDNSKKKKSELLENIDKPSLENLILALNDESVEIRIEAAKELGKIGDHKAVGPLIHALKDTNNIVRIKASTSLGKIGNPNAVKPLIQALKDNDEYVRESAERALIIIGDAAIESLTQALKDRESQIRNYAAICLGWIGSSKAILPLINTLIDEDRSVRSSSEYALISIGEIAVNPLIGILKDNDYNIRRKSSFILGEIGNPLAIKPLIQGLNDEHMDVRIESAISLGKIGKIEAEEPLLQAAEDGRIDKTIALDAVNKIRNNYRD